MNRRDFIYAASVGAASATMTTMTLAQGNREIRNDAPQVGAKLRTIEEHFASPGWCAGPGRGFIEGIRNRGAPGLRILEQLQEVGDTRLAEMDAASLDVQVLIQVIDATTTHGAHRLIGRNCRFCFVP
jgi:hypothetical protein